MLILWQFSRSLVKTQTMCHARMHQNYFSVKLRYNNLRFRMAVIVLNLYKFQMKLRAFISKVNNHKQLFWAPKSPKRLNSFGFLCLTN